MNERSICHILSQKPYAQAILSGSNLAQNLKAIVNLYPFHRGSIVAIEATGLPYDHNQSASVKPMGPFAWHVHDGSSCTGPTMGDKSFESAQSHYNPTDTIHPEHAGDLPAIFPTHGGYAFMVVYTDRFTPRDVIGKTMIIHQDPDDFRSQPAGNSGPKIACGVIGKV